MPFVWMEEIGRTVAAGLMPPAWLQAELRRRVLLVLNHLLAAEPQAVERLARQQGRTVRVNVPVLPPAFQVQSVRITPAGLLDEQALEAPADLTITLEDRSPLNVAGTLARGEKPSLRIEGDVQLAADIQWLVDHVRWDAESDLARLIGDEPAHMLGQGARQLFGALRAWTPGRGEGIGPA